MYKYLFFCRKMKDGQKIVFHIEKRKKRDKTEFYTELSTLSTKKGDKNVEYYPEKKNARFVNK